MYYLYLLWSAPSAKSYIGYTARDPYQRLAEHNQGANKFTRQNGPWQLKYYETFTCQRCAKDREAYFKTGIGERLRKIIIENL